MLAGLVKQVKASESGKTLLYHKQKNRDFHYDKLVKVQQQGFHTAWVDKVKAVIF